MAMEEEDKCVVLLVRSVCGSGSGGSGSGGDGTGANQRTACRDRSTPLVLNAMMAVVGAGVGWGWWYVVLLLDGLMVRTTRTVDSSGDGRLRKMTIGVRPYRVWTTTVRICLPLVGLNN